MTNEFKLEVFALELVYIQRWIRANFDRKGDKNARVLDEDLTRTLKSYRALKRTYYRNNGKTRKSDRPSPIAPRVDGKMVHVLDTA